MDSTNKFYLDRFINHKERSSNNVSYSIGRIDLMIISISGAGIYIIFETLRFLIENSIEMNLALIKLAGCSFAVAIVVNFASQWFAYWANKEEENWTEEIIREISKHPEFNQQLMDQHEATSSKLGRIVRILNVSATVAMLFGMVILVVFNLNSF